MLIHISLSNRVTTEIVFMLLEFVVMCLRFKRTLPFASKIPWRNPIWKSMFCARTNSRFLIAILWIFDQFPIHISSCFLCNKLYRRDLLQRQILFLSCFCFQVDIYKSIPGVAFLMPQASIQDDLRIANSRFRGWTSRSSKSNQASICVCTLPAISDRGELHFEGLWYIFKGVPPQSNYPPAAVTLSR